MKRLAVILFLFVCSQAVYSQEPNRFSPSWSFKVPGATKAELEERAYAFRMLAAKQKGMAEMPMYDTKHRTIWILTMRHTPELGRLNSLISTYLAIICEDGKYCVNIEKLELTAYSGAFRISNGFVVTEDESEYSDKRILRVIQDAKAFAIQQVEEMIPLIREKMETQELKFEFFEVK